MHIGILLISLGKYDIYFQQLYNSFEKFFLPFHKKTYFYLNDSKRTHFPDNVIDCPLSSEYRAWPSPTLWRNRFFLSIEQQIRDSGVECLFYSDVDMIAINIMGDEILPTMDQRLVCTIHPGFFAKSLGTPETRRISKAYIDPTEKRDYYVAGGFSGGFIHDYLKMCKEINENIQYDYDRGIIACWHDESHINRYMVSNQNKFKFLSPSYCYPESIYKNPKNRNYSMLTKNNIIPRLIALDKNHNEMRS